jgi:thiol-disulfide isomerase/thioredoxin
MMGPAEDMHATATTPAMTAYGEDMPGTPTPEAMMGGESGMMSAPAWFTATLTTATSAESFSIHDYQGKVVLVEMMAVWCTTCFQQQQQIAELHKLLGMQDDLVTVSLDIDPNEDKAVLKNYVQKNGFDWAFAVASKEVAREIGQLYGDQFLNPPSAPMLIIDRHGEAHPLPFGVKSAADLQKALEMYLKAGM